MKKEMIKKEMKDYMKGQLESMWNDIKRLRRLIQGIEEQKEQSENDVLLLEMLKNDKNREVSKACDLENLYIKFFGEKVGA